MEGGTNLCTRLRNRVCDALTDVMGCCNSKTELEALKSSSVGIKACELRAYDFASESFALDYTEQVQSPSVVGRNPSNGGRTLSNGDSWTPRRTHNVPKDYPSIQAALDAAHEGDAVRVAAGRYKEALVITNSILIFGVGKVGDCVLEAPDESIFFAASALPTVVLEAPEAKICNMTIVGGGVSVPVIENSCGDITLEGCVVRGGSCGIKVQESAGAIVRFCDVHDGREHGIYIGMQGWASVDKCHIFGCNTGVWVGHLGSQCSLRGSDLRACSQVGLIVHTQAAALLEANNITGNDIGGVCLSGGGRAVLSRNHVSGNGQVGVCVVEGSTALINDNRLRDNGVWSIYVAKCSASRVTARNNVVDTRHGCTVLEPELEAEHDEESVHVDIPNELLFSTVDGSLNGSTCDGVGSGDGEVDKAGEQGKTGGPQDAEVGGGDGVLPDPRVNGSYGPTGESENGFYDDDATLHT